MKTLEDCVEAALSELSAEVRAQFAADPKAVLRGTFGLKVQLAEHLSEQRGDGGACDGVSFLQDGVILYAPTPRSRRENFTLAHELGHWLVNQNPAIYDWLVEQPEPNEELETICDRIAQRLLLLQADIDDVLHGAPVEARHVLDLYGRSNASLPACAIALASRLPGLGAVLIIDLDGDLDAARVRYASVRPDPERGWPKVHPWPGHAVPAGHPLQRIRTGGAIRRRSFWEMPWGERADFYLDAVEFRDRWVVVMVDTDLWGAERFHPPAPREFDQRPEREVRCCGQTRKVRGYPCPKCDEVPCPDCGKCRCDREDAELVMCAGDCFLMFRPSLLVNGLCEECR
ncbi:ImmA/IrrE family metallo-endopeptidase [Sinomonas sp. ASV322]|uniref:ImmA/IrrE family metallo-endopeptidase n=1 Tax=Sinomonas sp. ASV322 TaxID=3041920 RepID=UPI0027DE6EEB|nr:ImmA/IrrE family metallo-endopeptidase [Sinomonas sp. ASV322]MDQ4500744.1 ImmA/IrrE family metallo-endopeptidase [Sinomonas sp. ASV322]